MPHSEKPWTTPKIAFDPLADAETADRVESNLPLELQLSLESSFEALAQADTDATTLEEAPDGQECFDLDETDASDDDGSGTFYRANRARPSNGFNLRNVVVPCGLVFGCFILLWTRDLLSPALSSAATQAGTLQTPRPALTVAPQTTDSATPGLLAPQPPVAPPMPVVNSVTAPVSAHAQEKASKAMVSNPQSQITRELRANTSAPIGQAQTANQTNFPIAPLASRTVNSLPAQGDNADFALSSGGPLNPINVPRSTAAPVVALPVDEPTLGAPMAPQIFPPSTNEPGKSKNKPFKRRRPSSGPRDVGEQRQPGAFAPQGAPMARGRKMKERPSPDFALAEKPNR